jgi:hypothetical protein
MTGFKVTGNVAIGGVDGDAYAYIATVEPFHGNTVAVYTKEPGASIADVVWKRTVLDVLATPTTWARGRNITWWPPTSTGTATTSSWSLLSGGQPADTGLPKPVRRRRLRREPRGALRHAAGPGLTIGTRNNYPNENGRSPRSVNRREEGPRRQQGHRAPCVPGRHEHEGHRHH